jgi:endonuclease/exonuclease/phosphatase family metal-dependent hydrolase
LTRRGRRALTALAWAAGTLVLAWALMRTLGLERGFPLVPLTAWTPFVIPLALVAGLAAALARLWIPVALAALAAALMIVAVAPRAFGGGHQPQAGASGPELRVMAANVKLGRADPAALVELVRGQDVDVLAIQELTAEMAAALQRQGLGELLPERVGAPAPGSSGSAVFSRLPLTARSDASLPGYPFRMPRASVAAPGADPFEIVSVHVSPPVSSEGLADWVAGLDALAGARNASEPTILAGDFNATLDHAELRDVLDAGYVDAGDATGRGLTPTWPQGAFRPPVTIDHVLADERVSITGYEVHDLPGSDHRAVSATLRLP